MYKVNAELKKNYVVRKTSHDASKLSNLRKTNKSTFHEDQYPTNKIVIAKLATLALFFQGQQRPSGPGVF
jgi:hypothetical protein